MPEICFQKIQYGAYYVHVINRNISDVIPIKSKPLSLRLSRTHDWHWMSFVSSNTFTVVDCQFCKTRTKLQLMLNMTYLRTV